MHECLLSPKGAREERNVVIRNRFGLGSREREREKRGRILQCGERVAVAERGGVLGGGGLFFFFEKDIASRLETQAPLHITFI